MYLVDTNVWLERLLGQTKSAEVGQFLAQIPSDQLLITDFTFHSIGVVVCRLRRREALLRFVRDAFVDGAVMLISLQPEEMQSLFDLMGKYNLDFDEAYQYVAAEKYDAVIVSLDGDFDQTERGRKTPAELLAAE